MRGCAADIARPSSATPILATPRRNILPTYLAVTCSFLHGLHPRPIASHPAILSAPHSSHCTHLQHHAYSPDPHFFCKRLHHTAPPPSQLALELSYHRAVHPTRLGLLNNLWLSTSIDRASQRRHLFCCDCHPSKVAQIASIRARLHSCAALGRRAGASVAAHRSQLLFLCSSSLCCPLRLCPHRRRTHSSPLLASSPPQ